MAAGARPQGSIPIAADIVAQLGDVKAAAKLARKEAQLARKEIRAAAKEGKRVAPEILKRLQDAERLGRELKEIKKENRAVRQGVLEAQKTGRALRFLFGAKALQGLAQGKILDPRNISTLVFGLQEVIESNINKFAATGIGKTRIGRKLIQGVKAIGPAAPAIGEAVQAVIQAISNVKRDALERKLIGKRFAVGDITKEEFAFFQQEAEAFKFLGDKSDLEKLKFAQSVARSAFALQPESMTKAFETAATKVGAEVLGLENIQSQFESRLREEQERLGRDLTNKEKFEDFKNIFIKQITSSLQVKKSFLEELSAQIVLLNVAEGVGKVRVGPKRKTAAAIFAEDEEQRIREINFMRARQRVAIQGAIND